MHTPVLLKETIELLNPQPGENFIDATVGAGGHASALLEKIAPSGKVLGIDMSRQAITKLAGLNRDERFILAQDNFVNLKRIVEDKNFGPVNGILADLGFSSDELEASGRGFSFLKDEPLDMRFGDSGKTAADLINGLREEELADIFLKYGEERFAKRIAEKIIEDRRANPITATYRLIEIIRRATPFWYHGRRLHPATKVFQALRIAVNNEFDNLINFLPRALEILEPNGRLAIISFHSLEDRVVKNFIKNQKELNHAEVLTKKPIRPSREEQNINPRSRSAKLRALRKK